MKKYFFSTLLIFFVASAQAAVIQVTDSAAAGRLYFALINAGVESHPIFAAGAQVVAEDVKCSGGFIEGAGKSVVDCSIKFNDKNIPLTPEAASGLLDALLAVKLINTGKEISAGSLKSLSCTRIDSASASHFSCVAVQ